MRATEAFTHAHGIADLAFEVNPGSVGSVSGDLAINGSDPFPRSLMLIVTVGNRCRALGRWICAASLTLGDRRRFSWLLNSYKWTIPFPAPGVLRWQKNIPILRAG
jgi:hypothetical protein